MRRRQWDRMAAALGRPGLIGARTVIARAYSYAAIWFRAFGRSDIDLSLRTHPGLVTRIVERPGRSLPQAELDELLMQLRIVAGKTLPAGSLTYGIFSGDRERLARAVVTVVSDEATGDPIAFNALSVMDVELDGAPVEVIHL